MTTVDLSNRRWSLKQVRDGRIRSRKKKRFKLCPFCRKNRVRVEFEMCKECFKTNRSGQKEMSAREQRLRAMRFEDAIQKVFSDPVKLTIFIQHVARCDTCRIAFRTILEHFGKKKT